MQIRSALLVALALAVGTTASAASKKKKVAKPTQDTGTIDAPPPAIPPATPSVGPGPGVPGDTSGLCADVRTIPLYSVQAYFHRLAGKSTTTIAGAKKVLTTARVEVTASKRRLFIELDGEVTSYDPSGGQTAYYGRDRVAKLLDIPVGCEIESVTNATGWAQGEAPPASSREVLGTGIVERVRCSEINGSEHCNVALGSVEVRLRPAVRTCESFTVKPKHVIGPFAHAHQAGDTDLAGAPVHLELNTAVVGDERDKVYLAMGMRLEQSNDDHTTFAGTMESELFDARYDAPGCRVKPFRAVGNIRLTTAAKSDTGPRWYTPPQGTAGVLKGASCNTDMPGPDPWSQPTRLVCGRMDFEPITVELIPDTRSKSKRHRK